MDGIESKFSFYKIGISKLMKVSIPNLNDMDFRSKESTEKKFDWNGIAPSYRPILITKNNGQFCPFSQ